jgi:hypothetical protein
MFSTNSRYAQMGIYRVTRPDGTTVVAVRLPLPPRPERVSLLGSHPRRDDQRLDHIANHYLGDPTTFWRLCDANDAVVPDALAARPLVGIPRPGP